ncbi:MAG: DUF1631 domain-containing protein [Polaromonas sp.]|nr:MAG: DUF1631 domain-containing protein [Polaromonas sp.]
MADNNSKNSLLARQARELFTARAVAGLPELCKLLRERLSELQAQPGNPREIQERRDAWQAFESANAAWIAGTSAAWKRAQLAVATAAPGTSAPSLLDSGKFELMDNEVVEARILASRFALRLLDFASWELNDLRLRIQSLEGLMELPKDDIFRPEVLARHLVDQWTQVKLSRALWVMLQDLVQGKLSEHLLGVYRATNAFLIERGVMAEIDFRSQVKRVPSGGDVRKELTRKAPATVQGGLDTGRSGISENRHGGFGGAGVAGQSANMPGTSHAGAGHIASGEKDGGKRAGSGGSGGFGSTGGRPVTSSTHYDTRMQSAMTPIARARMHAQGVMGHLKKLLLSHQVPPFEAARGQQASFQLSNVLDNLLTADNTERVAGTRPAVPVVYGSMHVEQASSVLRQRTSTLKQAASSPAEKATVEIVALMFQSILEEDRIAPAIRVWFARLQMPVLRVAIAEPEFFDSLEHPARRLIDRMGSCVLGFDVAVSGGAMEAEIKRVVQVIEQYPETGRRVFQLVYDEFQKFLSKFLSEQGSAARVVSVAQQMEQKETMTIQYTIEMRSMLNDMPVRDAIREFLFKVWAEVLAMAAMRNGPQHEQTIHLKRAAADLVWAASAKPNRADRAKVIADLPKLLQWLRLGMNMLGMDVKTQDQHVKSISDTLADAFMSKTDVISRDRIDAMAKRLTNLEDYLSDEDVGDLPLDTESLVMMIGIDANDIEVITDGGHQPTDAMRAWAQELELGTWFSLDHNGCVSHVQFAWRSDRKQLHLFASADGRNFLVQARRLAAYLQAGLLVPVEDELLTVRATRGALAKLDANPERLLN